MSPEELKNTLRDNVIKGMAHGLLASLDGFLLANAGRGIYCIFLDWYHNQTRRPSISAPNEDDVLSFGTVLALSLMGHCVGLNDDLPKHLEVQHSYSLESCIWHNYRCFDYYDNLN